MTVIKNEAYRRMHQRNHIRKVVEEYHVARREEKRVHKKGRRNIASVNLKNWNISGTHMKSRAFYQKLNKSKKKFQPKTTLCKDKESKILSGDKIILGRWVEYCDEWLNANVSGQSEDIGMMDSHED
jgi:hypothetical protein